MLEQRIIKEHLERSVCYKCGSSLETAKLFMISEAPMALLAHAICANCQGQTMLTITATGSGTMPVISDLWVEEIKRFMFEKSVTYDDLLGLHKKLEKKSICSLLRKKDKKQVKKSKV
jgi:hypothetical protein